MAGNNPLNKFGDSLAQSIGATFSAYFGQDRDGDKKPRGEPGSASAGRDVSPGKRKQRANPFPEEQSAWLRDALTESLGSFGRAIDKKMSEVHADALGAAKLAEQAMGAAHAVDVKTVALQAEVAELKERAPPDPNAPDWKAEFDKLQSQINDMRKGQPGSAHGAGSPRPSLSPSSSHASASPPPSGRRLATMGNLGWDCKREKLEERYKEVLALLRLDAEDIEASAPITNARGVGSKYEILFATPEKLQLARLRCEQVAKTYEDGRTVWVGYKKDQQELRPGRQLRKLAKSLRDLEKVREENDRRDIVVNNLDREVLAGDVTMAYLLRGEARWSDEAKARYPEKALQLAADRAADC